MHQNFLKVPTFFPFKLVRSTNFSFGILNDGIVNSFHVYGFATRLNRFEACFSLLVIRSAFLNFLTLDDYTILRGDAWLNITGNSRFFYDNTNFCAACKLLNVDAFATMLLLWRCFWTSSRFFFCYLLDSLQFFSCFGLWKRIYIRFLYDILLRDPNLANDSAQNIIVHLLWDKLGKKTTHIIEVLGLFSYFTVQLTKV
jgi:hypothetical protein